MFSGRLTLVSGSPIMSGDVTSQTLYYTQHCGDKISIGGADYSFSEMNASLYGTAANTNYDCFASLSSGSPCLSLGPAWTNDTTRSSPLARNNGILTNAGNTGTYLGTIRTDAAGYCSAHFTYGPNRKFGVWNAYNQIPILLQAGSAPTGVYYPTAIVPNWGPLHNDAGNCLTVLSGLPQPISLELAMTKAVMIGPASPYAPPNVTDNSQHNFAIGWNRTDAPDSTTCGLSVEAAGMPTYIQVGITASVPYISDPLMGSAKATAIEDRCNYVAAWSGHRDEILTARLMG